MTTPTPAALPAKRPYAPPALIIHGDVQTLTQGKNGLNLDQDGGGSFTPLPGTGGAAPTGQ